MKQLLFIAFAACLLLTGCLHSSKEDHTYILDNPSLNITEGFEITEFTLPGYLCSTEMRYTSEDGELHSIPGYKWALPLDRLLKATSIDTLRNLPKSSINAKRGFRFDRVCLTSKNTLLFVGDISIQDDAIAHKAKLLPFRMETKVNVQDGIMDAKSYRQALTRILTELLQKDI